MRVLILGSKNQTRRGNVDDRTAYAGLLEFCDEPNMFFPGNKKASCNWSPIGSGSDEDNEIHLRYYATDARRARWLADFNYPLPEKQPIPHPRPWIPVWDLRAAAEAE